MASLYPNLHGATTVEMEEDDFHSINSDNTMLITETDQPSAPLAPSVAESEGYTLQNALLKSLHLGALLNRQLKVNENQAEGEAVEGKDADADADVDCARWKWLVLLLLLVVGAALVAYWLWPVRPLPSNHSEDSDFVQLTCMAFEHLPIVDGIEITWETESGIIATNRKSIIVKRSRPPKEYRCLADGVHKFVEKHWA